MKVSNENTTSILIVQHFIKFGLLFYCLLLTNLVFAQKDKAKAADDSARLFAQQDSAQQKMFYDSVKTNYDSAATQLYSFLKKFGGEVQKRNIKEYSEDTIATRQDKIIGQIKRLTLEAENYLNGGIDTSGLSNELSKIQNWYEIASDGIFINTGSIQTHRNLETSYQILRELSTRILARKESLDDYHETLVHYRNTIDSFYQEKVLYKFPEDSIAAMRYINKLIVIAEEIKPIDSALKKAMITVAELQTTVNRFVNTLNTSFDRIADFQQALSKKIFNRETSSLGQPARSYRPFNEILGFSLTKAALSLVFYAGNGIGKIVLVLLLVMLCAFFLKTLKKHLDSKGFLTSETENIPVLKFPWLSSVVMVLNIFQFVFVDPPFLLNSLIWTLSSIALTIVARNYITKYWRVAWYVVFTLFLLACADNLILQASRVERWMMLVLSVGGVVTGLFILFTEPKKDLKEKLLIYFVAFLVVMQVVSIITNINGHYNFPKACLTSGFFSVIIAILFFWTVRLVNDSLSLASKAYSVPGKKLFRINFDRVGDRAPKLFYVLLVAGWFVLFTRNFYIHKIISKPIKDFIHEERVIGEFSFTIENMLLFFLILYLTGFLSRFVSFFSMDSYQENNNVRKKAGLGSWLLVVRISIVLVGFLLALAAIGLPMDRLTIVLSALGVGVGFGLQTLVNNLVSGLIISFEKPVNVGDIVEISGRIGTIKSIGFRSSIISTGDGSDVVIPNGELLNQPLVNWTSTGSAGSVNIVTVIAHGTDVQKAIKVLKALPGKDDRILPIPEPTVIIRDYNEQLINIQLSFWVRNIRERPFVKSDLILAMDSAFKENGIELPVPRHDITIHSAEKEGNADKDGTKKPVAI